MAKLRVGNKQNSKLNGEWAGHVRGKMKKVTSSKRRMADKDILKKEGMRIDSFIMEDDDE